MSCIFRTVYIYSTVVIQSSFIIQYLHNSNKKCLVFELFYYKICTIWYYSVWNVLFFTNGHNYFYVQWLSTKSVHFFFLLYCSTEHVFVFCRACLSGFFFRDSFLPITFVEVLYIKIWLARPQFTAFPSSMQHSNGHIESNLYRWL